MNFRNLRLKIILRVPLASFCTEKNNVKETKGVLALAFLFVDFELILRKAYV